jgi:MFS family permease
MFGIGFAIGPLLGSLIATLPGVWGGNFGIGIITGSLSLFNFLLALKILPETLTKDVRRANRERHDERSAWWKVIEPQSFRRAFAVPHMKLTIVISFISIVAFSTLTGTFTLFIMRQYTRPQVQTSIRTNPQAAIDQARSHLKNNKVTASSTRTVAAMTESAAPVAVDNKPYAASMGGDFNPREVNGVLPPQGSSWREVEKALVQPLAAKKVGLIFATIGVLALLIQGGMINPLKKRFGEIKLVIVGVGMLALGLALVPLPHSFAWQFPVAALLAIGNSISAPVLTALVSLLSPEAERGEVLGVFQSTQSLGRIIGPIIGNYLFDWVSVPAPYYVGALIMLVAFALTFKLRPTSGATIPQTETARASA